MRSTHQLLSDNFYKVHRVFGLDGETYETKKQGAENGEAVLKVTEATPVSPAENLTESGHSGPAPEAPTPSGSIDSIAQSENSEQLNAKVSSTECHPSISLTHH